MLTYEEKKKFLFEIAQVVESQRPWVIKYFGVQTDLLFRKKGSFYEISSKKAEDKLTLIRIHDEPRIERRSDTFGWDIIPEAELEKAYEEKFLCQGKQ